MNWPNDADGDGDVLRRLESDNFDFNIARTIDFNIDFNSWPLSSENKKSLNTLYPNCVFIDPDEEDIKNGDINGYIQFSIKDKLTYNLVIETQKETTEKTKQFGGWCESWGVSHNNT